MANYWVRICLWAATHLPLWGFGQASVHFRLCCRIEKYCAVIIVLGDQCLWVTLDHEFTTPRTYTKSCVSWLWRISVLHYQQNYVPANQDNFGNPQTIPPRIKMIHSILPSICSKIYLKALVHVLTRRCSDLYKWNILGSLQHRRPVSSMGVLLLESK